MTEYAIVEAGRNVSIHTGTLMQGGFDSPGDAYAFITEFGLRRCQVVAISESNGTTVRRWLDGYEVAESNRALTSPENRRPKHE